MKRLCLAAIAVWAIGATAMTVDVFSDLHISPADAKDLVSGAVTTGLPASVFGVAGFKAATPAARAAMVNAGVAWLKSYVASAEFKQRYLQSRDTIKPQAPVFKGTPEDEAKAAAPQDPLKNPDTQKMLAALPPDQRKQVEESLKQMAAVVAQQQTPAAQQQRVQMITAQRANETQAYQKQLATWQQDFPADPHALVIRRVHEFLDMSATVDFTAQTTGPNHTGSFVNPAYESKPAQWKLCFRAGKDATTAARTAAQAWLKDLGG